MNDALFLLKILLFCYKKTIYEIFVYFLKEKKSTFENTLQCLIIIHDVDDSSPSIKNLYLKTCRPFIGCLIPYIFKIRDPHLIHIYNLILIYILKKY